MTILRRRDALKPVDRLDDLCRCNQIELATTRSMQPWLLYVRVSTQDQAEGGVSLEAQTQAVRAYATAKGWAVADVVVDAGASGKDLKRPGIRRVVQAMRDRSAAGVIAWRLDRLTRSLRDLLGLLELAGDHFGIVSVTESLDTSTPMGRFTVNMLGSIAQWERETIAGRVKAAMQHVAASGYWCGSKPLPGTKVVQDGKRKRLVAGEHADAVRQAFQAVIRGASLREAAKALRDTGVPTGGKLGWTPARLHGVIHSPRAVPALVDAATQAAALATLAERPAPGRGEHGPVDQRGRSGRLSPLSGLIRCPTCGASMCQASAKGRTTIYWYARCTNRPKGLCGQKDLPIQPIEADVVAGILRVIRKGEYREAVRRSMSEALGKAEAAKAERGRLMGERERTDARIAELALHGTPRDPGYMAALRHLGSALVDLDKRIAELEGVAAAAGVDAASFDLVLREVEAGAEALASADLAVQREVLQSLVESVIPRPAGVEAFLYPPDGFDGKSKLVQEAERQSKALRFELPRQVRPSRPVETAAGVRVEGPDGRWA